MSKRIRASEKESESELEKCMRIDVWPIIEDQLAVLDMMVLCLVSFDMSVHFKACLASPRGGRYIFYCLRSCNPCGSLWSTHDCALDFVGITSPDGSCESHRKKSDERFVGLEPRVQSYVKDMVVITKIRYFSVLEDTGTLKICLSTMKDLSPTWSYYREHLDFRSNFIFYINLKTQRICVASIDGILHGIICYADDAVLKQESPEKMNQLRSDLLKHITCPLLIEK